MDGAGKSKQELLVIGLLEAVGTMILFMAINFSQGNFYLVISGLFTGIILSGRLTGAHFNTSVTISVLLADDFKNLKGNLPLAGVLIFA
jgi:glycerol uptake facilitator-like aquaporin